MAQPPLCGRQPGSTRPAPRPAPSPAPPTPCWPLRPAGAGRVCLAGPRPTSVWRTCSKPSARRRLMKYFSTVCRGRGGWVAGGGVEAVRTWVTAPRSDGHRSIPWQQSQHWISDGRDRRPRRARRRTVGLGGEHHDLHARAPLCQVVRGRRGARAAWGAAALRAGRAGRAACTARSSLRACKRRAAGARAVTRQPHVLKSDSLLNEGVPGSCRPLDSPGVLPELFRLGS